MEKSVYEELFCGVSKVII